MAKQRETVVLAYSGGLDTSYCIAYLRKELGYDVITVTVDTGGFTPEELAALEARAHRLKAVEHITLPAQDIVFNRYVSTLIRGNVLRGQTYPLCVAAERVTQAEEAARIAREKGAAAIAHGSTGAGNDQIRFDVVFQTLAPGLKILAPIRDQGLSRQEEYDYLKAEGIDIDPTIRDYSINAGLWGATIGGKETHDSWQEIPEDVWTYQVDESLQPKAITITFDKGLPVALDGKPQKGSAIIAAIEKLAQAYGFGRGYHLGDTVLGIKGRVAFQAGAALLLIHAHRELEKLVLTNWQRFWKDHTADFWGKMLHEAQALDPVMQDIRALIDNSQERVTGDARVTVAPGRFAVTGVKSPYTLMRKESGLYGEEAKLWNPQDPAGFGQILGVPGRLYKQAGTPAAGDEPEQAGNP